MQIAKGFDLLVEEQRKTNELLRTQNDLLRMQCELLELLAKGQENGVIH